MNKACCERMKWRLLGFTGDVPGIGAPWDAEEESGLVLGFLGSAFGNVEGIFENAGRGA